MAIVAGLAMLRFAWVWVSLHITILRTTRPGTTKPSPNWRLVATTSFAGVRGALTLAGVLTLPLVLNDGSAFPARDLAIFLAAGVIVLSLVMASIALPILFRDLTMPPEPSKQAEEDSARMTAAEAAIQAIERHQHMLAERHGEADIFASAGARVMDLYRERIEGLSGRQADEMRAGGRLADEFSLIGVKAECAALVQLTRDRQISSEILRKIMRELELAEARYRG